MLFLISIILSTNDKLDYWFRRICEFLFSPLGQWGYVSLRRRSAIFQIERRVLCFGYKMLSRIALRNGKYFVIY